MTDLGDPWRVGTDLELTMLTFPLPHRLGLPVGEHAAGIHRTGNDAFP